MAQYTFIDPNTLLPGDPWTSALAQASFENPEAISEGAPGAPRVDGKALALRNVSFTSSTSWREVEIPPQASFFDIIATGGAYVGAVTSGNASYNIQISFSTDGGSTWGSSQTLFSNRVGISHIWLDLDLSQFSSVGTISGTTGSDPALSAFFGSTISNSSLTEYTSSANRFRIRSTDGAGFMIRCTGGVS